MTELIPASPLFILLFVIAVVAGAFWWGSWHGRKYTAKHERVENTAVSVVERIRVQGGDKFAALERELDRISAEADAKADLLRAEFRRRFGD